MVIPNACLSLNPHPSFNSAEADSRSRFFLAAIPPQKPLITIPIGYIIDKNFNQNNIYIKNHNN